MNPAATIPRPETCAELGERGVGDGNRTRLALQGDAGGAPSRLANGQMLPMAFCIRLDIILDIEADILGVNWLV